MKYLRPILKARMAWIAGIAACALLLSWKFALAQDNRSRQLAPAPVALPTPIAPGRTATPNTAPAAATPAPMAVPADPPLPPPIVPELPATTTTPEKTDAAADSASVPSPTPIAAPALVAQVTPTPVAPPAPVAPAATTSTDATPTPGKGIIFNFQGASLKDVLNYLSESAGFVILTEATVTGTVNIVSRQPVTPDEAVDLLNTVLNDKGYTAVRNGRVLKIINRKDAIKNDLPVETGSDPAKIPHRDEVVTQILPLKFGDATKLVENLRPLLSDAATITANEASNAILMTDTQTNIRRIATIIKALDTSVASISSIHVYPLQYADAKEVADLINQLFGSNQAGGRTQGGQGGRGGFGGFGRFGGGFGGFGGPPGGPGGQGQEPQSEARQAESKITAVADVQSNSVIVSAPEGIQAEIQDIISQIDTTITDITTTRIFRLHHADSVELAGLINSLYGDGAPSASPANNRGGTNGQRGGGFQPGGQGGGQNRQATPAAGSERSLQQAKVTAVGDPRTNSLVVTASKDTMAKLVDLVGRLDATDSRQQHVYVHALQHADAENVADVLRGMLGQQTSGPAAAGQTSTLLQRTTNGASINAQDVLNTNANATGS